MPLEKKKSGCYNKGKKNIFSISFSFSYLSLFVDTLGSSGQRSRGSPFPARPGANAHTHCRESFLPFAARYRSIVRYSFFFLGILPTGSSCTADLLPIGFVVMSRSCPFGLHANDDIFESQKEVFLWHNEPFIIYLLTS